ncbi:hypothetical protein [Streptomyces sp. NPDC004250]|uniref:hypothetical protein n=1 Tax=Streptomyces sp. NPDC004250 TaxID=3364692 RepID=UPI003696CA7F
MNDGPLRTGVGDAAVFQRLVQRAFEEDMLLGLPLGDARAAGPDCIAWCSSGSGKSLLYLLEVRRVAASRLGQIRGELDRLGAMSEPESSGGSTSPAQFSSAATAALQVGRSFRLAARVHALHEQAAALESLLALLHCALEQLLADAVYPCQERVVRTAASPCGVIGLTAPRLPRAPGPVRLLYRTEPTAGAAAA